MFEVERRGATATTRSARARALAALGALLAASGATMCAPSSSTPVSRPSEAGEADAQSCLTTSSRRVAGVEQDAFVIGLGPERIYVALNTIYTQGGSGAFSTSNGQIYAVVRADGRREPVGNGAALISATEHAGSVYWLNHSGTTFIGPGWPPGTKSLSRLGLLWRDAAGSPHGADLGPERYPCAGSRPQPTSAGVYVALEVTSVPQDAGAEELGSVIVLVGGDAGVQTVFHASESWTTCTFSDDALYYVSGGALRRHGLVDGADTLLADHLDVSSLTVGDTYVAASSAGDGSVLVFDRASGALLRTIDARSTGDITAAGSLLYWWRLETSTTLTDAKRTLVAGRADGSCITPIGSFPQSRTGASDGTGFAFSAGTDLFEATAR